jgi:hypothetical protein
VLIKVAVLATLVWVSRRALVRWVNGPERIPSAEPWPPIGETREAGLAETGADRTGAAPAPAAGQADKLWLPPDESGACPVTHPVKAKRSTRLYREPGSAAYDRSRPDRCYASARAAESDGYTRAKR